MNMLRQKLVEMYSWGSDLGRGGVDHVDKVAEKKTDSSGDEHP